MDTHPLQKKLTTFLGDALSWLTGTATTKEIHSIKNKDKPTYCHTSITMHHPSTHCVIFDHHKVHHTG